MTKEEAYTIIKIARNTVNQIEKRRKSLPTYRDDSLSENTIAGYKVEYARLINGTKSHAELISKARSTTSIRTWHRRRAAIIYVLLTLLKKFLSKQDKMQKNLIEESEWLDKVKYIKATESFLTKVENEPALDKSIRKPAKSKKKDLRGLPKDWREQIIHRMPTYQPQILTLAITGCRPSELVKGIKWRIDNNKLIAEINGAKISKHSGQETRILSFKIEGEIAKALAEIISKNGGSCEVTLVSAVNLTTAIRSAAQRAFPKFKKSITAYSFRHQAAADWKALANTSSDPDESLILVSGMLGHATNLTKGRYGHSSQSRGSLMPEKVDLSRQVKVINKMSFRKLPFNPAGPS
jgi:integrase